MHKIRHSRARAERQARYTKAKENLVIDNPVTRAIVNGEELTKAEIFSDSGRNFSKHIAGLVLGTIDKSSALEELSVKRKAPDSDLEQYLVEVVDGCLEAKMLFNFQRTIKIAKRGRMRQSSSVPKPIDLLSTIIATAGTAAFAKSCATYSFGQDLLTYLEKAALFQELIKRHDSAKEKALRKFAKRANPKSIVQDALKAFPRRPLDAAILQAGFLARQRRFFGDRRPALLREVFNSKPIQTILGSKDITSDQIEKLFRRANENKVRGYKPSKSRDNLDTLPPAKLRF